MGFKHIIVIEDALFVHLSCIEYCCTPRIVKKNMILMERTTLKIRTGVRIALASSMVEKYMGPWLNGKANKQELQLCVQHFNYGI